MDNPLVTLSIVSYNQEEYVRDAVRGALAQTYEPLEIVISDDHSTDRTWEIICQEIEAYKKGDCFHSNIILNRNERNLGISGNVQKVWQLLHGELVVDTAGDDIAHPDRVEKIVEAWLNAGKKHYFIHHRCRYIDLRGKELGFGGLDNTIRNPSGAMSAYRAEVITEFPVMAADAYEDWVIATRAMILGDEQGLAIDEVLVDYRIGSGVTASNFQYRAAKIESARGIIASFRQSEVDLESRSGQISRDLHERIAHYIELNLSYQASLFSLCTSKDWSERFKAWRLLPLAKGTGNLVGRLICLLPQSMGDRCFNAIATCKRFKARVGRMRV